MFLLRSDWQNAKLCICHLNITRVSRAELLNIKWLLYTQLLWCLSKRELTKEHFIWVFWTAQPLSLLEYINCKYIQSSVLPMSKAYCFILSTETKLLYIPNSQLICKYAFQLENHLILVLFWNGVAQRNARSSYTEIEK